MSVATKSTAAIPPTLEAIPDQTVIQDHPTHGILLTVHDSDTPLFNQQFSGTSSNPTLIPRENIFFGTAGPNWYFTLTPVFGQTGTATITVTVNDGTATSTDTFLYTVTPPPPGAARFANTSPITIPQTGAATPYPSPLVVSGMSGTVTKLILTLSKFSHQRVSDVDMLLVGPTGQGVVIFSGISGGNRSATDITVNLTDEGLYPLPLDFALWSEALRPADWTPGDSFPGAPPGPYGPVAMSTFNGLTPNGTWSLYIYDPYTMNQGAITGGWSLMIATTAIPPKPTISTVPDQSILVNSATTALPFTVGDPQTPPGNLTVTANSSNPTLVPVANIVLGGTGANRTVLVTPAAGQTGTSLITLTVNNGTTTTSSSFLLTVTEPLEGVVFTNPSVVTIPDGVATPSPSTIAVAGVAGLVTRVTVILHTIRHTHPADLDMLLVGPSGQKVIVFSDAGGSGDVFPVTVTLSDAGSSSLPLTGQIVSGTYKPTDYEPGESGELDSFPGAPGGPYSPTLAAFNGLSPNGTWSLYVVDDGPGDVGSIDAGWSLAIVTTVPIPPTLSEITDQTTVVNTPTAAIPFTVADDATEPADLIVTGTSSDPTLVPDGNIVISGLGADRTVVVSPAANRIGTTTITLQVSDGVATASRSFDLEVTPASLIVTTVDATRTYGTANPSFDGTVQGLQPGDVITLGFSAGATPASPVGSYPITPLLIDPDGKLPNYTIVTNKGALTVTPALLTGTADNKTRLYGTANPSFTATYTGFVNGEDDAILTGALVGQTPADLTSPVGPYIITVSGQSAPNYSIQYLPGTLTIDAAPLNGTADNKSRLYGTANPPFTATYTGFVNGENDAILTGALAGETPAELTSPVGPYLITVSGQSAPNYSIQYLPGTLEVTAAQLTVNVTSHTRPYGAANPALTGTLDGLRNADAITLSFTTDATPASPVGSYPITPNLVDPDGKLPNYTVSIQPGELTITAPGAVNVSIQKLAGQRVRVSGTGDGGVIYTMQASSDLVHWETVGLTTAGATGAFEFEDDAGSFEVRFYRVILP